MLIYITFLCLETTQRKDRHCVKMWMFPGWPTEIVQDHVIPGWLNTVLSTVHGLTPLILSTTLWRGLMPSLFYRQDWDWGSERSNNFPWSYTLQLLNWVKTQETVGGTNACVFIGKKVRDATTTTAHLHGKLGVRVSKVTWRKERWSIVRWTRNIKLNIFFWQRYLNLNVLFPLGLQEGM